MGRSLGEEGSREPGVGGEVLTGEGCLDQTTQDSECGARGQGQCRVGDKVQAVWSEPPLLAPRFRGVLLNLCSSRIAWIPENPQRRRRPLSHSCAQWRLCSPSCFSREGPAALRAQGRLPRQNPWVPSGQRGPREGRGISRALWPLSLFLMSRLTWMQASLTCWLESGEAAPWQTLRPALMCPRLPRGVWAEDEGCWSRGAVGMLRTDVYFWPRGVEGSAAPRPRRAPDASIHLQGLLGAGRLGPLWVWRGEVRWNWEGLSQRGWGSHLLPLATRGPSSCWKSSR